MSLSKLEKAEPNLVPMLDLVLQLVMFFILCANFLAEDLNTTIKLPTAIQARPLDKSEDYVIFLNVDKKGHVILGKGTGKGDVLTNAIQVQNHLRETRQFDEQRIARTEQQGKKGRLSLVVVRADKECQFKQINDIMLACRRAGYADVQLRAVVQASATK